MKLSARNQLDGVVSKVTPGVVTAEIIVKLDGGEEIVSVITVESARNLDLQPGKRVKAIIKSTEIMLATD